MNRLQKQIVSGVVTFSMLLTMLPTAAFAAERNTPAAETEPGLEETLAADGLQDTEEDSPARGETESSQQRETPEEQIHVLSATEVAYPVEGGNIYFDTATGTITDCYQEVTKAEIPAAIEGVSVTSIGKFAFSSCDSLTSVTIPDSVTTIGLSAFSSCSSLTSVTIPDSVTTIGNSAFSFCSSLTSVTIPDSVTAIEFHTFYGCTSLTHVIIGNSVSFIESRAFYGCINLTDLTIPDSVTTIGDRTFSNCDSLTSITIPDSVTTLESGVFSGCDSLTDVTLGNSVESIAYQAFLDCNSLVSVNIPNSVTSIGNSAFRGTGLTSVVIPDSVISIGNEAFAACTKLSTVIIGDSVISIGIQAFLGCDALVSVDIPDSVTNMGRRMFAECENLGSVTIGDSVTSIGDDTFSNCTSLSTVIIGESVTSIGDDAFENCISLTSVTIPDSVTTIGIDAFYNCRSLASATIGDGVITIQLNAFLGCSSMTTLTMGANVTNIGENAFNSCSSLKNITIPDKITTIAHGVFCDCNNLTSIVLPDGVTTIESGAFMDCKKLTNITIPDSVTNIGEHAFSGCNMLTNICLPIGITGIEENAFEDCNGLVEVTIPDSVIFIGNGAFSGCSSLTTIAIPDHVTSIGDSAFSGCGSLAEIVIPDGVTEIGNSAFSNCDGLTYVTIPDSVTSIGDSAFSGCDSLTDFYVSSQNSNYTALEGVLFSKDCTTLLQYPDGKADAWYVIPDGVSCLSGNSFYACSSLSMITLPASIKSIYRNAFGWGSLDAVYYAGSETDWNAMTIESGNNRLTKAPRYYNSTGPASENLPGTTGASVVLDKGVYQGRVGQVLYLWASLRAGQGDCQYLADNLRWSSTDGEVFPADASDTWRDSLVYNSNSGEAFCMVIPRKAGQAQVTVTAPDGATSTCTVQVADAANRVTMDDSIYLLREGDTGKIFADITAQFGLEGVEWTWSTNNSSVVAFDQQGTSTAIGSVSVIVGQPLFSTSASIDIYALGEGTATISCTLPNGVTASQEISVTGTGDSQKTVVSNDYNVPKYQDTPSNEGKARLRTYEARWQEAYRDYLDALKTALAEIQADEIDERDISVEQQAAALREADESSKNKYLTFPSNFPAEWKDLAYQAISSILLDGAQKEKLDLSDIISTDSFSTASGIVNEISRNISNVQKKFTFDGVKVEVSLGSYFGAHLGEMTFRSSSGGRTYSVVICSKQDTLNTLTAEYLTQLKKLGYEAVESVYEALAEDVLGKPISKLTEPYLQKTLAKFEDFLRGKGLGVPYEVLVESYDYYTQWKKIFKSIDHYPLENAENLLKSFEIEDTSASEKVVKKALDALEKAMQKLSAATIEYLYTGTVTKEEPSLWESFKSFWGINCPVSVAIYDASGTEQLGLVGDSLETSWYNEDRIYVEEAGGAKQIYANEPITFRAVGQDYGTMSCYVELYENGAPIGRLNFYDIALQPGTTILLPQASKAEELQSTELVVSGESVAANEFISPDTNARVTIDISVSGQGEVLGGGPYVRGDGVVLQVLPEDGYQFCGWYDQDGALLDVASIVEFTAREDRTLTALFVEDAPPTLTNYAPKLCAPYQDLCTVQVEQQQDEVMIFLKWLGEEQHRLTAYLTYYNDDGQMTDLTLLTAAQTADGVDFTGPVTQDAAKLLLLDEALQPVLEAYTSE